MPHEARTRKGSKVVQLDDYRPARKAPTSTIEIRLLPGGGVSYSLDDLNDGDAFRALLGCYALAGELLLKVRDNMKPCADESRGTSDS